MQTRKHFFAAITTLALLATTGCAVTRDQETMGAYIDDAAITANIKSRFFEDKTVTGMAISVETLKGTVLLSGFARSTQERNTAENLARGVKGVKAVKNEIIVSP